MNALKATVVNGRFVIEEPADLPEGTELYLVRVSDEGEHRSDTEEADAIFGKASRDEPISLAEIKSEFGL